MVVCPNFILYLTDGSFMFTGHAVEAVGYTVLNPDVKFFSGHNVVKKTTHFKWGQTHQLFSGISMVTSLEAMIKKDTN